MIIIDGSNLTYRFYFASHQAEDAIPMWLSFLSRIKSTHGALRDESSCIVVFDGKEKVSEGKPDGYKQNRPQPPESLILSIERAISVIRDIGFAVHVTTGGVEADSDIARFAKYYSKTEPVHVISSDKDLLQLVGGSIKVVRPLGKSEYKLYSEVDVLAEFGVPPDRIPDLLTLAGDSSDGIKGLKGCGKKTAVKLLADKSLLDLSESCCKWGAAIRENIDYLTTVYSTVNIRRLKALPCEAAKFRNVDRLRNLQRVYPQITQVKPL